MSELNELAAALAKAQGEIQPAPKDADNPFFKSKYASLPAIREAMQEAFAKNGLSVVQMPETIDGQLRLRTMLLHESGQTLLCGSLGCEVDVINPQKIGSAITYFRRYALAAISQTVADEDDDGEAAVGRAKPKPKALTEDEKAAIQVATENINACTTSAELVNIGKQLVSETKAVQDAVREDVYKPKKLELDLQELNQEE